MDFQDSQQDFAAFDMGISTLQRINYRLWKCNEAQEQNDVDCWYENVKIIYKETMAFFKKDGKVKTKQENNYKQTQESYRKYIEYRTQYSTHKRFYKVYAPPKDIFEKLLLWEMELRDLLEQKGLLMRKTDDPSSAMI